MEADKYPDEVTEAVELYRQGKQQESRDCLRDFLLQQPAHINALLWLAKVTPDPREASAAAELALKLDPGNEVAQRALIAVRERVGESSKQAAEQAQLSAAVALSTGMTLAQGRAVNWPFRRINRPIGEALDDETISLSDLGWAVERVSEARIRDAAKTILLTHWTGAEPKKTPRPLKVVVCSRFIEQQERRATMLSGCMASAAMALSAGMVLLGIILVVLRYGFDQRLPEWVGLVVFAALGLAAWSSVKLLDRFMDRADQYRTGRWGEEKVMDTLRYALDSRWILFRNFEWPYRKWGDVDLILVGPGGVWVFEVKAYSSQVRNTGDRWERKDRWWHELTTPPGHQARRNAARVREYLSNNGVELRWVQPVVAWAGEPSSLTVQDPATPVWDLEALSDRVAELWQGRFLSEDMVRQVVDVLQRAVQAAKEQE
jgi:hypothetical protein